MFVKNVQMNKLKTKPLIARRYTVYMENNDIFFLMQIIKYLN